jgi:very-short-patch-repair endonuclease
MSDRLSKSENRVNLGRGKPSWMEKSFADWLDEFGIKYRTEVQFKNHTLNKYYYADFVFDKESLIIELDGNHHRFTKEKDAIRDDCLKNYYGYDVLRVTHKEYRSKVKLPVIKNLLGIPQ